MRWKLLAACYALLDLQMEGHYEIHRNTQDC